MAENSIFDGENAEILLEKAAMCRRLAAGISDSQAADVLRNMAQGYERDAKAIREV